MFKQGSCADEIFGGMEDAQIEACSKEDDYRNNLIIQAMEELNSAAESFEIRGRTDRAMEVTALMMSLADDNEEEKEEKTNKSEAEHVFMFLGFSPEDLKDLNLSSE